MSTTIKENENDHHHSVKYVWSDGFMEACSKLPAYNRHSEQPYGQQANLIQEEVDELPSRSELVHSLIEAFGILENVSETLEPEKAMMKDLQIYHSKEYVNALYKIDKKLKESSTTACEKEDGDDMKDDDDGEETSSNDESDSDNIEDLRNEFGIVDDGQEFRGMFNYALYLGGACTSIAKEVNQFLKDSSKDERLTIMNFEGGRHHARKSKAAGFCYVNDVVMLSLLIKRKKILCIDIDIHHGDGTEEAFLSSDRVFTISFHQFGPGLYPGTGSIDDNGTGRGKYRNLNVPLKEGLSDRNFKKIFSSIVGAASEKFQPDAVILVMGADNLNGDPLGTWNLSLDSFEFVTRFVKDELKPKVTIILGGGGYNYIHTAIAFATVANIMVNNCKLPELIPEHSFFELYKSVGFSSNVDCGVERDENSEQYLKETIEALLLKISQKHTKKKMSLFEQMTSAEPLFWYLSSDSKSRQYTDNPHPIEDELVLEYLEHFQLHLFSSITTEGAKERDVLAREYELSLERQQQNMNSMYRSNINSPTTSLMADEYIDEEDDDHQIEYQDEEEEDALQEEMDEVSRSIVFDLNDGYIGGEEPIEAYGDHQDLNQSFM